MINLDRSADRLSHMQAAFETMRIAFQRVPAVDGRLLDDDAVLRAVGGQAARRSLTRPEIGCALSHMACWRSAAGSDEPFTAIFEDDMHFSADAAEFLRTTDWIPADADIVKIETFLLPTFLGARPVSCKLGHSVHSLNDTHVGAGGYLISRRAARVLLEKQGPLRLPVDRTLFGFKPGDDTAATMRIYQLCPAICVQEKLSPLPHHVPEFGSLIDTDGRVRPEKARRGPMEKLSLETRRTWTHGTHHLAHLLRGRVRRRVPFGRG